MRGARCRSWAHPVAFALGAHARCPARAETTTRAIEDAFKDFTNRDDIAVVLINQYVRAWLCGRLRRRQWL